MDTLKTGITMQPVKKREQSEGAFKQPASLDITVQMRRLDACRISQRIRIRHCQVTAPAGFLLVKHISKVPGRRLDQKKTLKATYQLVILIHVFFTEGVEVSETQRREKPQAGVVEQPASLPASQTSPSPAGLGHRASPPSLPFQGCSGGSSLADPV